MAHGASILSVALGSGRRRKILRRRKVDIGGQNSLLVEYSPGKLIPGVFPGNRPEGPKTLISGQTLIPGTAY